MQVTINGQTGFSLSDQQLIDKFIKGEEPNGIINGVNATFTSRKLFISETVEVYINGLKQMITKDYITTGYNTIILFNSLELIDQISINYTKI